MCWESLPCSAVEGGERERGGRGVASWVACKLRVARGAPFQKRTPYAKIERKNMYVKYITYRLSCYNALLMTRSVSSLTEKLEALKKNTPDGRF